MILSIRVMTQVWANSQQKGSGLILLLAIADHANDDGYAYPGVETLAKKSRMSERNTRYVLDQLVAGGELAIARGTGPKGTNEYRVLVSPNLELFDGGGAKIAGAKFAPATERSAGVQPSVKRGATAIAPESSVNVSKPSERATRATRLKGDWVLPKAWGEWALTEQPTWTPEHVRKVALIFFNHWTSTGKNAAKTDWLKTWQNWVWKEPALKGSPLNGHGQPWFLKASGIEAKGKELGMKAPEGKDGWQAFRDEVYQRAGVTDEMLKTAKQDAPR